MGQQKHRMLLGATEIRVYFHQAGKEAIIRFDTLIFDNGSGMSPHTLSRDGVWRLKTLYQNRRGIGRYGMGMKAAALSMSPVMERIPSKNLGDLHNDARC